MADLSKISCAEDLDRFLEQYEQEEIEVIGEIDELLKNEQEYEAMVNGLVKHMSNISMLESDAQRLSNLMNFTLTLAENVSYKIKSFDLVKSRVSDCLKQVEDIIDLRSCTAGIQKSLMCENYEEAARHIYRFLSMDESMLRKASLQNLNDPNSQENCSLEQSLAQLHEAQEKLQQLVLKRFDESVEKKDLPSIERFFKIFPLINLHREGLEKFSSFLCLELLEKMNLHSIKGFAPNETRTTALLSRLSFLFESIAQTIEQNHPLIETFYGPGNLYHFVVVLQKECDKQTQLILNDFKNEKNFHTLSVTISKLLKNMNSTTVNRIDSKDIDAHLTDIMIVVNRIQAYLSFVHQKLLKDTESITKQDKNNQNDAGNDKENNSNQSKRNEKTLLPATLDEVEIFCRDCPLTQMMHDINSVFVLLAEYFLKESIQKAIQIDTIDASICDLKGSSVDSVITSSMLDDIFFIIKKCFKMSISTGSLNVILAMINNCVGVLETTFYEAMNERIRFGYPNAHSTLDLANAYNALQAGRYLQSSTEIEKKRVQFISALNNLDFACEYIEHLSKTVTDDVKKFNVLQKNNTELFNSCLNEFESTTHKLKTLISTGMQALFTSVFKSSVKTMVDSFSSHSHTLSENDVLEHEATDGIRQYMQHFLIQFSGLVNGFRKQLTSKNFDSLLISLIREICTRLYKSIFKCTFNKVSLIFFI